MITLKEKKMLLKMKTAMGESTNELRAEIEAEEHRLAEEQRIAEEAEQAISEDRKSAFQSIFADLSKDISKLIADDRKKTAEQQAMIDQFAGVMSAISSGQYKPKPVVEVSEEKIPEIRETEEKISAVEEKVVERQETKEKSLVEATVDKVKSTTPPSMFVQPDPSTVDKDIKSIQQKMKMLEGWVSKISMTGPGGGAVRLRDLEDVSHYPTKNALHGQALVYNSAVKKWEPHFITTTGDTAPPYPNDGDIWYNTTNAHVYIWLIENEIGQWVDLAGGGGGNIIPTTTVTTSSYTVAIGDEYIGVNYAGRCTITLPVTPNTGRVVIIKDESGHCSLNPIAIVGTIDNDINGASLRIDNGALQLVYRAGWRIV